MLLRQYSVNLHLLVEFTFTCNCPSLLKIKYKGRLSIVSLSLYQYLYLSPVRISLTLLFRHDTNNEDISNNFIICICFIIVKNESYFLLL